MLAGEKMDYAAVPPLTQAYRDGSGEAALILGHTWGQRGRSNEEAYAFLSRGVVAAAPVPGRRLVPGG